MFKRYGIVVALVALYWSPTLFAGEDFWKLERYWGGPRKPLVDVSYGQETMRQKVFDAGLPQIRVGGIKLGYFRAKPKFPGIGDLDDKYLFFEYSADKGYGSTSSSAPVHAELLRFGIGSREGYAYDFKSSYLYPYTQTSLGLTKVSWRTPTPLSTADQMIMDRYHGGVRLTSTGEVGLAYGIGDVVSLHAGYATWTVNPRLVFWPWLGSQALSSLATELISNFGDEIVEGTPALGPVIYTVLRGAVLYSFYLLSRDGQYWPFRSERPLTGDGFRVGMTFTF